MNRANVPDMAKGCLQRRGTFLEDSEGSRYMGNLAEFGTLEDERRDFRVLKSAEIKLNDG